MTASPSTLPGALLPGIHSARPAATAMGPGALYFCSTHKLVYQTDGTTWSTAFDPGGLAGTTTFPLETFIGDGTNVITAGSKAYIHVPAACTITSVVALADVSGSVAVEVRRCTYTNFDAGGTHPVTGDKISASAPVTISGATKSKDSTLTGWTLALAADDVLELVVTGSPATIKRLTIDFVVTR